MTQQRVFLVLVSLAILQIVAILVFRKAGDAIVERLGFLWKPVMHWLARLGGAEWDRRVQWLDGLGENELAHEAAAVLAAHARRHESSAGQRSNVTPAELPKSLLAIFDRYSALAFGQHPDCLRVSGLPRVVLDDTPYLVVGDTEDEGEVYLVRVGGNDSPVWIGHLGDAGVLHSVEQIAPSVAYFVVLQKLLYDDENEILAQKHGHLPRA